MLESRQQLLDLGLAKILLLGACLVCCLIRSVAYQSLWFPSWFGLCSPPWCWRSLQLQAKTHLFTQSPDTPCPPKASSPPRAAPCSGAVLGHRETQPTHLDNQVGPMFFNIRKRTWCACLFFTQMSDEPSKEPTAWTLVSSIDFTNIPDVRMREYALQRRQLKMSIKLLFFSLHSHLHFYRFDLTPPFSHSTLGVVCVSPFLSSIVCCLPSVLDSGSASFASPTHRLAYAHPSRCWAKPRACEGENLPLKKKVKIFLLTQRGYSQENILVNNTSFISLRRVELWCHPPLDWTWPRRRQLRFPLCKITGCVIPRVPLGADVSSSCEWDDWSHFHGVITAHSFTNTFIENLLFI